MYMPEKKLCWVGKATGKFWVTEVEQAVVGEVICCSEISLGDNAFSLYI